jgi:hypothetical protein
MMAASAGSLAAVEVAGHVEREVDAESADSHLLACGPCAEDFAGLLTAVTSD